MENLNKIILCITKISKIPKSELEGNTKIYESKILSSLQMIELISELENAFNISIEAEDLIPENFDDINAIRNFVEKK
jgi:acyl carrier protein